MKCRGMPFFHDPFFRHFFGDHLKIGPQWQPRSRTEQSLGSGVIVSSDGYILTNNHVVEGAYNIKIAFDDNKVEYQAEIIGTDPKTDIAVLKVNAKEMPAIVVGDSEILEIGDFVVAIGNPFGLGQTVTGGMVSVVGKGNIGTTDYKDFIQTDASINPGNSGGALVDAQGRLIGISTAIISRDGGNQGIGLAVPINLAKNVMERILSHGRVIRSYLGVHIQDVTSELSEFFRSPNNTSGVIVSGIMPDSAAQEAGITKGDIIIEFDEKKVKDVKHLRLMEAENAPDTGVVMKVIRDGKLIRLKVKLQEVLWNEIASEPKKPERHGDDELLIGIIVGDLIPGIRRGSSIPPDINGALIIDIKPSTPGYEAGLRLGDIIMEIDSKPVKDASDAMKASRMTKKDSVLLHVWNQQITRYVVVKNLENSRTFEFGKQR